MLEYEKKLYGQFSRFFFFLEGRLSAAVPTCHQIFWPDTYLISSSRW
jgi:hypothetical protein